MNRSSAKQRQVKGLPAALDHTLGDVPSARSLRYAARQCTLSDEALLQLVDSPCREERRLVRLFLLSRDSCRTYCHRLFSGLSDSYYRIRSDTARLLWCGEDRTRLYNRLIRLIREDPHRRVRQSAGERLSRDFADLYTLSFEQLPPLSQMLILDALEGHNSFDEQRAEKLLMRNSGEAAFRAACRMEAWGALSREFKAPGPDEKPRLIKASELGVAGFLEKLSPRSLSDKHLQAASALSVRARRRDLYEKFQRQLDTGRRSRGQKPPDRPVEGRISASHKAPPCPKTRLTECTTEYEVTEYGTGFRGHAVEQVLTELLQVPAEQREAAVARLPLHNPEFRKAVNLRYPAPLNDSLETVLMEAARLGQWPSWAARARENLHSPDPDIRAAAAKTCAALRPDEATGLVKPLLGDAVPRVRLTARRILNTRPGSNRPPETPHNASIQAAPGAKK